MSDVLIELRDTLNEIIRMHQLNLELLEQLDVACGWILKNNIQIPNREKIVSLLTKARTLLREIYSPLSLQHRKQTSEVSDEFLQDHRSDEDFTEPDGILIFRRQVHCVF